MRDKNEVILFLPRLVLDESTQGIRKQEERSTGAAEAAQATGRVQGWLWPGCRGEAEVQAEAVAATMASSAAWL